MGSYHGTCGVTNLPIENKDEVVLFVVENVFSDGICGSAEVFHSDTFFNPVSPPTRAIYNDYGQYRPVAGGKEASEIFLKWIKELSPDFKHIVDWRSFEKTLGDGGSVPGIEGGRYGDDKYVEKQITIFPIHAAVYEKMIAYVFKDEEHKLYLQARVATSIVDASFESLKNSGVLECKDNFSKDCGYSFMKSHGFAVTKFPLHELAAPGFDAKGVRTTIEDIPEPAMEYVAFKMAMNALRKTFAPLNGLGSQSTNYELQHDIGSFVADHSKNRIDANKLPDEKIEHSSIPRMI